MASKNPFLQLFWPEILCTINNTASSAVPQTPFVVGGG
jgi:hypothetical protein